MAKAKLLFQAKKIYPDGSIKEMIIWQLPTQSVADENINTNIDNLCRCGTYVRVRKAIHRAAELSAGEK